MPDLEEQTTENPVQTMRAAMEKHLPAQKIEQGGATFIDHAADRKVRDVTADILAARRTAEAMPPMRRKGTARLNTLGSLIDWANRFKGDTSALYLDINRGSSISQTGVSGQGGQLATERGQYTESQVTTTTTELKTASRVTLTAVANYHAEGGPELSEDKAEATARHCDHRGVYDFPLSESWKRWTGAAREKMSVADFGEFIEDNARDLLDPTENVHRGSLDAKDLQNWEQDAIEIAQRLKGEYASVDRMVDLGRSFAVTVAAKTSVKYDRQSQRANLIIKEEHSDEEGQPLKLPRLFLIAIPVFEMGDKFPLVCTFNYTATGPKLHFDLYDAQTSFEDAVTEAGKKAHTATELPLFYGIPE